MLARNLLLFGGPKRPFLYDFAAADTLPYGVSLTRSAAGNVVDSTLALVSRGVNVPRFEYDVGTGLSRGLLIEVTRTNLIRNNTMVGAAAGTPGTMPTNWANAGSSGTTISVVGTGTENGVNYIDIRWNGSPSSTGDMRLAFETTTGLAAVQGDTLTASLYARVVAGSLTNIGQIRLAHQERNSIGTSLATQLSSDFKVSLGASLYRAYSTATMRQATTANCPLEIYIGVTSGSGIDVTLRIGLPQMESGPALTTPIKTSGSTVARNGDLGVLAVGPYLRLEDYGTWVLKGRTPAAPGTITVAWFMAWDGTSSNRLAITYTTGGGIVAELVSAGGNTGTVNLGAPGANTDIRIALRIEANSFAASLNGGAVVTDTSCDLPTVPFTEGVLRYTASTRQINSTIKSIEFRPERANNATLQTLSA